MSIPCPDRIPPLPLHTHYTAHICFTVLSQSLTDLEFRPAQMVTPGPDSATTDTSNPNWKRYTFEVFVRDDGTTGTPPGGPLPVRKSSSSGSSDPTSDPHGAGNGTIPTEIFNAAFGGNSHYKIRPVSTESSTPLNMGHIDNNSWQSPAPSQHGAPGSSYGGSNSHASTHSSPRMHPRTPHHHAHHQHTHSGSSGSGYHPSPKMEQSGFTPGPLPRATSFTPSVGPLGGAGVSSSRRTGAKPYGHGPPPLGTSSTFSYH